MKRKIEDMSNDELIESAIQDIIECKKKVINVDDDPRFMSNDELIERTWEMLNRD